MLMVNGYNKITDEEEGESSLFLELIKLDIIFNNMLLKKLS